MFLCRVLFWALQGSARELRRGLTRSIQSRLIRPVSFNGDDGKDAAGTFAAMPSTWCRFYLNKPATVVLACRVVSVQAGKGGTLSTAFVHFVPLSTRRSNLAAHAVEAHLVFVWWLNGQTDRW